MRIGLCLAGLLSVAGVACSGNSGHARGSEVPGTGSLNGTPDGFELPGVKLELSPSNLRLCDHPDGRMTATLTWDARAAGVKGITIWVSSNPRSKGARFFEGAAMGSTPTGSWVVNNTTFRLKESGKHGRLLAIEKISTVDCLAQAPAASANGSPMASVQK